MSSVLAKCAVCNKAEGLARCSLCRTIYYCSKDHQKQDWKKHKPECNKVQEQNRVLDRFSKNPSTAAVAAVSSTEPGHPGARNKRKTNRKYVHTLDKQKSSSSSPTLPSEGSSETEILSSTAEHLGYQNNTATEGAAALPQQPNDMSLFGDNSLMLHQHHQHNPTLTRANSRDAMKDFPEYSAFRQLMPVNILQGNLEEICENVIKDMNDYGVCLLDNFIGETMGKAVLAEVQHMHSQGVFKDGQLVSNRGNQKSIRGDQIAWIDGREQNCSNIQLLLWQVDKVVMTANKMLNNGKLGEHNINGRTKAMVACYPGSGTHYVKHVDNPNRDGRCLTAIYYLNLDWDVKIHGGLLRIFPEGWLGDKVADIEPIFDRLVIFWSNRRNPHEVQPAFKTRYAITLWYFDAAEREEALRRFELHRQKMLNNNSSSSSSS